MVMTRSAVSLQFIIVNSNPTVIGTHIEMTLLRGYSLSNDYPIVCNFS